MKVRIATVGAYPDGMASTYRIHCYAKALQLEGVHVEVISAESGVKLDGRHLFYNGKRDGIEFKILWNKGGLKTFFIKYLWSELKVYIFALYNVFTVSKYDVLFLYDSPSIPALLLIRFCKLLNKKVVLELNEYPYATAGSRVTRIKRVNQFLKWFTLKLVLPSTDGIVCISDALEHVVHKNAPITGVLKVPILIGDEKESIKEFKLVDDIIAKNEKYIFHAGSLSIQKDGIIKMVSAFAKAANSLKIKGIKLNILLTNKNTQKEVWHNITANLKNNNLSDHLIITGFLSEAELNYCLQNAAVLVINKPITNQNKYNFPTKVGDYLNSKTPVVIAAKGLELNNYITNGKEAIVVGPDDVDEMSRNITNLLLDSNENKKIGMKGQSCAQKNFHYSAHSRNIKTFFSNL